MHQQQSPSPYQDKLHDPWSSHSVIREILARERPGARILDVGSATGTLGRLCQGLGLELWGLEPMAAWAEQARPFYNEMRIATVDDLDDDYLSGYDVVVFGDVLEHMATPERTLRRLVQLQRPGARFIISVPNVANLWVRLNLLLGRFNYTDRGILDRTHLRFFTQRTFRSFLKDAGLTIERLTATPIPLPLVHPTFSSGGRGHAIYRGLRAATNLRPPLLGYQFVAVARRAA